MSFMKERALFFVLFLAGAHQAVACAGSGAQGMSAAMLDRGAKSFGLEFEYSKWDELGHDNAHELHEAGEHIHNFDHDETWRLLFGYGLSERLELDFALPFVRKTFLRVEEDVVGHGDASSGLGDAEVSGKYRFLSGRGDASLIGGVKFPTGETSETGFDGKKLEIEEAAGSGSFDHALGIAYASPWLGRWSFAAGALHRFKTQGARDYEFGDETLLSVSSSFALGEEGRFPCVHLTAEAIAQFTGKDKSAGSKVSASGGEVFYFSPGVSADFGRDFAVSLSVPVPVYQNLGGEHSEIDYRVVVGVRWNG